MTGNYDVYMCREKSRQKTAKSELLEHFRKQMEADYMIVRSCQNTIRHEQFKNEAGMHMQPIKDETASKVVFVMLITLAVIIGWMLY